jgi:hypothetical protein
MRIADLNKKYLNIKGREMINDPLSLNNAIQILNTMVEVDLKANGEINRIEN